MGLEEVSFFHDSDEIFLGYGAVSISVSLIDHFLKLVVRHGLAQLLGHSLQVLQTDAVRLVVNEKSEGFSHFFYRVAFSLRGEIREKSQFW